MRELRKDAILGSWTIISTERAQRPSDFKKEGPPPESPCRYCRTVSVDPDGDFGIRIMLGDFPITSCHEVIIESANHHQPFDQLASAHAERIVHAWRERVKAASSRSGVAGVVVFKNNATPDRLGREYVNHPRSEILALPVVPKRVEDELRVSRAHFAATGRCVYCDVLAEERRRGERIIDENDGFTALCPFASHSPYEIMVVPRAHEPHFTRLGASRDLAAILQSALGRIRVVLGDGPYYLVLHTAPVELSAREDGAYHWHIEIAPRTFFNVGLDWGGGVYVNPILPEDAAVQLKEARWTIS